MDEYVLIGKAVTAAKEAYEKVFDDNNIDAAFYPINIEVGISDSEFNSILHKIYYKDTSTNGEEW